MIRALPAVLTLENCKPFELAIMALPAVLDSLKFKLPLLMIVAPRAVLEPKNCRIPLFTILAAQPFKTMPALGGLAIYPSGPPSSCRGVEAAITSARILTRPTPRLEDEGMAHRHCFHIASRASVRGSRPTARHSQVRVQAGNESAAPKLFSRDWFREDTA